jgi:hypothetical protein
MRVSLWLLNLIFGIIALSFGLFSIYTSNVETLTKFVWVFGTWTGINSVLIIYLIYRLEAKEIKIPRVQHKKSRKRGLSSLLLFIIILFIIIMIFFILNTIKLNP